MISEMEQPYFNVSALHIALYRLGDIDHVEIHVCIEEERDNEETDNERSNISNSDDHRWKTGSLDNWFYLLVNTSRKEASFPL